MAEYGWGRDYIYNIFGADEHLRITLYRLSKSGKKWKPVKSWAFSTFLMERLAESRGEKRIQKLQKIYGATPI